MWRKWWTNNASKWQMGFNLAFKGLKTVIQQYGSKLSSQQLLSCVPVKEFLWGWTRVTTPSSMSIPLIFTHAVSSLVHEVCTVVEKLWNCRWLAAERCNLEGTIKSCNLLHAPATYKFILHFMLLDIFGGVKVWEKNMVDQKPSFYYLLGKTCILYLFHIPEKFVVTEKNVRFQVLTLVLLRIQVFFKMSGSCHPVTV